MESNDTSEHFAEQGRQHLARILSADRTEAGADAVSRGLSMRPLTEQATYAFVTITGSRDSVQTWGRRWSTLILPMDSRFRHEGA